MFNKHELHWYGHYSWSSVNLLYDVIVFCWKTYSQEISTNLIFKQPQCRAFTLNTQSLPPVSLQSHRTSWKAYLSFPFVIFKCEERKINQHRLSSGEFRRKDEVVGRWWDDSGQRATSEQCEEGIGGRMWRRCRTACGSEESDTRGRAALSGNGFR